MAELDWTATTPLSRIYAAGRHGVKEGAAGLSMAELTDFELVQVMARRGQWERRAPGRRRGLSARRRRQSRRRSRPNGALLIWSGPDQFLVLSRAWRGDGTGTDRPSPAPPRCRNSRTGVR